MRSGSRHAARPEPLAAKRGVPSVSLIPLLAPWVAIVVVAELLPEPGRILQHQVDATNPLRRLPEVQVRDQQACWPAVLRGKIVAVVLVGDPSLAVEQILQRQVCRVTAVAEGHGEVGLSLDIAEDSFSRPFQVETIDDPQDIRLIATGDLTRHYGEEKKPLVIYFNQEAVARKLRLQITDYSNPTLNIQSIDASAPARQLVFELKSTASQPLRLYFGNEHVQAPHYDFENEAMRLSREPVHSQLGDVAANPEYKPEPKPLTERAPWLIYVVLAVSSIALAFVLLSLARTATKSTKPSTDYADSL